MERKLWARVTAILTQTCCATTWPISDHYDGARFFNPEPNHPSFGDMVTWLWEMETVSWPDWIEDPPQAAPPARVEQPLRITFVNHATILIQTHGLNILTDPIWSRRAGPVSWLGPARVRAPGVSFEELPAIDCVLISHDHYDHLDRPTLEALAERDQPLVVTGLGNASLIRETGIERVVELDWWAAHALDDDVELVFVPARHGSGRTPLFSDRALWGGFVIDTPRAKIYFAGDTAHGSFLEALHSRFPELDVSILPIGSYEKRWYMQTQHMNPEDAVRAHLLLGVRQSIGMHFGTFAEHPEQTVDQHEVDLATALQKHGVPPDRFWILELGEGREVPISTLE